MHLQFNDGFKDQNVLPQARAGASWLADLIKQSTGKSFTVKPMVVFPGWYIQDDWKIKSPDVRVLNPKQLPWMYGELNDVMSFEDLHLVSYHLSRYIRTFTKDM